MTNRDREADRERQRQQKYRQAREREDLKDEDRVLLRARWRKEVWGAKNYYSSSMGRRRRQGRGREAPGHRRGVTDP